MAYAAQLETPCTHCCLPALAATAPGLATQRHPAPASGSAPGSRPGAQVPLGDGPLFWILCQLAQIQLDASVHACTVAACSCILQSGGYRCHPHHRRNGICSSPIAGFARLTIPPQAPQDAYLTALANRHTPHTPSAHTAHTSAHTAQPATGCYYRILVRRGSYRVTSGVLQSLYRTGNSSGSWRPPATAVVAINLEIRGGTTEAKSEIGFFGPSMRSSR